LNDLHLLVALGEDRYALPVEQVREVLRSTVLTPVPGAPAAVRGVLNLRGEIVPALDTAALLELSATGRPGAMVVVEAAGLRAGLAVHALIDVVSLPLGLEPSDDAALLGSALVGGSLIGVIDVPALLDRVGAGAPA
jgi:purine-binding chemotaxis protein CheW